MFRSDANRLYFGDAKQEDILPSAAALHNLIHKQGYQDIALDFSRTTFFDPVFMVPFVTMARSYRSEKVEFEIIPPQDQKISRLFTNSNWAHLLSPERFVENPLPNTDHLSAVQFRNAEQQLEIVQKSIELLLAKSRGLGRSKLTALEWALNEITDNVLNHSESIVGGILQVITFSTKKCVAFYVCDAGIGIAKSLRSGRPDLRDDLSAVREAIEQGVTRNKKTNQGNGLFGTFKCCEVSRGNFDILTGVSQLRYKPGDLRVARNHIPFPGTFIRAVINYDVDNLLEKALVFAGKSHNPPFDYVERFYETDSGELNFEMKKEVSAFGSREGGREARTKIENLMDEGRNVLNFDFSGLHLISSSFADEVFGKLFVALGPVRFNQLCKFRNVDPTVRHLIDRAISQRIRE